MPRKEHSYHYIYKTINLINQKYYIGLHSTSNLEDGYIGSGKRLWYSIKKYGKENFKCEILEFLPDRNSLKEREKELVNEDILKDKMCMNLQPGGGGGFVNEEHRTKFLIAAFKNISNSTEKRNKKLFELHNNPILSKQWGKNVSKGLINYYKTHDSFFLGKNHTEQIKKLIGEKSSINQKGLLNSQFGTCWITNGKENKKIKKEDIIPQNWYKGRKTR